MPTDPDEAHLDNFVRDLFRKDGFRRDPAGGSDQAAIVKRILVGKDVVGLLPTGAGKSLPYMLAGLLLPGLSLYVGPLKSLLQDQAERLLEAGIAHVKFISSAQDQSQKKAVLADVASTGIRFLLVSPERFLTRAFIEALKNRALWQGDISQVVIDECHCVSEWGHEFRPAYLSLGRIARERTSRFSANAPLVALTGTASTIVLSDVIRELGIADPAACIRAVSLDRSEISIKCTRVNFPNQREKDVENAIRDFLEGNATPTDGALVFCPFRGGRTIGVFSVAAHLIGTLKDIDVRFFAGGESPWKDFAVFRLWKRSNQLTAADIEKATPAWALDAGNHTRPWEDAKSAVQRNFVSGTANNFRVLVATKAFGMGIDKPSIRKVVHVVAPTSPEAYYQEIGRAGRDRIPSEAELLFCDIQPDVTNRLLDPQSTEVKVKYSS
ncbi:MAG: ATP-dependent DNA helicase RecQ [Comamonadaceae bacterium]|nr:ATP-dependent DNA helicase RecQ [Comamonadaceae bacterium]